MHIQWYPGHMTKAKRAMTEDLRMVSLVIELADARVPMGSRNPDIDRMANGKDRIILLNKADLADQKASDLWKNWYDRHGIRAVLLDSRQMKDVRRLKTLIREVSADRIARDRARGIKNRPIRAMVCGIPNVGKSTFINSISGRTAAKTGNKPGVTRADQWIKLDNTLELLDTPGILWPKFDDALVSRNLALTGSISDDVLPSGELALELLAFMRESYPEQLKEYLKSEYSGEDTPLQILEAEAGAIEEMFANYEALGFIGGLLYQNGEPVAFTAGTKLDEEVFDVHFEKALPGVEGAYTMVNREFARLIHAELPGIGAFNREEDMGLEGLRKAKESYHPDILLMKYFAREK